MPLPGGPATSVTPPATPAESRSKSARRATTRSARGPDIAPVRVAGSVANTPSSLAVIVPEASPRVKRDEARQARSGPASDPLAGGSKKSSEAMGVFGDLGGAPAALTAI